MKNSHVLFILSAVYLSPHMTVPVGIGVGIYCAVFAFYQLWKES